ncbi:MAG: glycosyltransferase [Nitrospirae bacterium]|nr:MAG: glycosyltransferase [Nitrospirota bacterium]
MTISVILPTLNEEHALPRTLAHTLGLGFDEILVVDGGSTDHTCGIVSACAGNGQWAIGDGTESRKFEASLPPHSLSPLAPRLALLASPAGRAIQMNTGAAASRGEVLLFLHADTQLPRDAKPAIVHALQEPTCVGGRFDLRFEQHAGLAGLISRLINLRSRCAGIATGDQALFVRRSIFEQMGGFSAIPIMEDVDFTRRLKRMGRTAALRSQVVTSYRRWDSCGPIRTILLMWLLRFLYWIGVSPQALSRLYRNVR